MSKTKSKTPKGVSEPSVLKVKDAGVTKSSKSAKSQSKEVAKEVAAKEEKKSKKSKKVKEPTPEPSESEDESSAESASSDDDDEDEVEVPVAKAKVSVTNGKAKTNGAAKVDASASKSVPAKTAAADASDDEDEEEDSDDSDDSEQEAAPKSNGAKISKPAAAAESSDESDSSEDDEDEAPPKNKGAVNATALSKKLTPIASEKGSSAEEEEDEDSSDEDSDEEEEETTKAPAPAKKRKAEAEAEPVTKKSKTEVAPESGNLFVGNLSWNIDEEWLTREFEEFGELSGVRIIMDRNTGRSKGFGYVEFVDPADAVKAHAAKNGADIDNRAANVDFATKKDNPQGGFNDRAQDRAKNFGDQKSPESDTLFIGNISFDATTDIVSETFADCGSILSVRLPTDQETGAPKGFGYVQFSSVDEARGALETMNGVDIAGRNIRLDFSTPRSNDSPRGGRGGGRGGFDRGGRGGGRGRGGFGDRGGRGGGRGGFGDRGGRGGGFRGGRGASTNRGGFGDFQGKKMTF